MRVHCQISLLILSQFEGVNQLLFTLKSSENLLVGFLISSGIEVNQFAQIVVKEVKFGDDPLFGVGESPQKGYDSKPHPN